MSRTNWGIAACLAVSVAWTGCSPPGAEGAGDEAPEVAGGEAQEVALATGDLSGMTVRVYKSPTCGCCANWVEHLREAGFQVEVEDTDALAAIKAEAGVPVELQSCHTARVGEYVFEGHVPAEDIAAFLEERPDARGLAVPGMPVGSPGMEMGDRVDPYDVLVFDEGSTTVYRSHR